MTGRHETYERSSAVSPAVERELEAEADRFLKRYLEGEDFARMVDETYVAAPALRRRIVDKNVAASPYGAEVMAHADSALRDQLFVASVEHDLLEAELRLALPDTIFGRLLPREAEKALDEAAAPIARGDTPLARERERLDRARAHSNVYRRFLPAARQSPIYAETLRELAKRRARVADGALYCALLRGTRVYSVQRGPLVFAMIREIGAWKLVTMGVAEPHDGSDPALLTMKMIRNAR